MVTASDVTVMSVAFGKGVVAELEVLDTSVIFVAAVCAPVVVLLSSWVTREEEKTEDMVAWGEG